LSCSTPCYLSLLLQDKRISFEEWHSGDLKSQMPFGQMPVLEVRQHVKPCCMQDMQNMQDVQDTSRSTGGCHRPSGLNARLADLVGSITNKQS
jgi:hypothetical protein